MFTFNKAAKAKIDRSTEQVLELESQKKQLQIEKEQISIELDNMRKRNDMKLEEERHKQKLVLETEKAVFDREKQIWQIEKKDLVEKNEKSRKEFENQLKRELDLQHQEATTLLKLESQQMIKQAELDKEREVNALKAEVATRIAAIQGSEAEKYYSKLTAALQEISVHGDHNSKFAKDLALKLFDRMPTQNSETKVTVDMPKLGRSK